SFGHIFGREVDLALGSRTDAHYRHQLPSNSPGASFDFHVATVGYGSTEAAPRIATLGARFGVEAQQILTGYVDDSEPNPILFLRRNDLQRNIAILLLTEPSLLHKRHSGPAVWILARDRPRPEVGDGCEVARWYIITCNL